jgi:predicted GNAT family N-acyltransferase
MSRNWPRLRSIRTACCGPAPAHQGKGLGKLIMREIMAYVAREVPDSGYVSLIADGKAHALYAQFGFVSTAPASIGMAWQRS